MSYRWKPNAHQKELYKNRYKERDSLPIIHSSFAIRKGCYVEFYSLSKGEIVCGDVINSSYGEEKGQHTFTVLIKNGDKLLVKGRNVYPNLIKHIPGEISKSL